MIVGRALINSIEETKSKVESLGGELKSNFIIKDIIFVPYKEDYNLTDDFVRLRVNIKSNWNTRRVVVTRKKTEFQDTGKVENYLLKEELDSEEEAFQFIQENLSEFKQGFNFKKEGWQYQLNDNRIFIEDIQNWKPSVEIEAKDESELKELFDNLNVLDILNKSVPEIMENELSLNCVKIVSGIIINEKNEILMLKRSADRKWYPNKWNFLSGTVEKNEKIIDCIYREIGEELGSDLKIELIQEGTTFIDNEDEGIWKIFPFKFRYLDGNININHEHSEYSWVKEKEFQNMDIVPGILNDLRQFS